MVGKVGLLKNGEVKVCLNREDCYSELKVHVHKRKCVHKVIANSLKSTLPLLNYFL